LKVGRTSFLKKRSKKLLPVGTRLSGSVRQRTKVFWFFFSKKEHLLASSLGSKPAMTRAANAKGLHFT
jgi:hypothetical protein